MAAFPISPRDCEKLSMSDAEADAVVASALSFLDEFYAVLPPQDASHSCPDGSVSAEGAASDQHAPQERASPPIRQSRRRDTNRARALARRELLALRTRAGVLTSELIALTNRRERRSGAKSAGCDACKGAVGVWKGIAGSQLDQCVRSKCENQRLRALVAEKRKVLLELRRHLMSRVINEATREFCVLPAELRLPAFNLDVIRVMQELSRRIDAAYSQVDALFDGIADRPTVENGSTMTASITNGALRKLVARHSLPFDAHSTGEATWHHLSRVIRPHALSLFSYRDEGDQATCTVTEYFGMKLTHGVTSAEFRVTQTMRRYEQPGQEVIIYESVLNPMTFSGKRVQAGAFQERGVVRITPQRRVKGQASPLATVEVCYNLTPPSTAVQEDEPTAEQQAVDALAKFVLQSMMAVTTANFHKIENILFDEAVRRTKTQTQ